MSTLEVLMKAEKSLLDKSIPFDFDSWYDCTCGHILRAVEGKRGYAGYAEVDKHSEYARVIQEVAVALGHKGGGSFMEDDVAGAIYYVSQHTAGKTALARQNALKTVRTAMMALQPVEQKEYVTAQD